MKNIFIGLALLSSLSAFADNCDYNSNDNELMPKTRSALTQKGYALSTDPEASYALNTQIKITSFNNNPDPIFIPFDVEGVALFKNKKTDNSYVSTTLKKNKIAFARNLSRSKSEAFDEAIAEMDEKSAKKVINKLVECTQ